MATPRRTRALLTPALLLAGILAVSGCASSTAPSGSGSGAGSGGDATDLAGTSWVLKSYAGPDGGVATASADGEVATLTFAADGSFAGSTGCNRLAGTYVQDGASLTIAPGPMTLRACPGGLADQEAAIVTALPQVATFTSDADLVLQDSAGVALLTYAPGLSSLAGTSWQATGINNGNQAVVSQDGTERVTATFGADGTLSGSGGCNTYSGTYTTTGTDGLTIGPVAATEMACPEPAMEIEQQYFAALGAVTTYLIEGTTLTLRDSDGATQATFRLVP